MDAKSLKRDLILEDVIRKDETLSVTEVMDDLVSWFGFDKGVDLTLDKKIRFYRVRKEGTFSHRDALSTVQALIHQLSDRGLRILRIRWCDEGICISRWVSSVTVLVEVPRKK